MIDMDALRRYIELERLEDHLDGELKDAKREKELLAENILNSYIQEGVQSMNVDGRTVYLNTELFAGAAAGAERPAVVEALKSSGFPELVKEDYNANTLKGFVRERVRTVSDEMRARGEVLIDPADALPAQLRAVITVYEKRSIRSRKA